MIHAWKTYGYEAAEARHGEVYYRKSRRIADYRPSLKGVLQGKLSYLRMVKGPADRVYWNLLRQLAAVDEDCKEYLMRENERLLTKDTFMCYAGKDGPAVSVPLANELLLRGLTVWIAQYELRTGDRLMDKINEGLRVSRYGIVILSPSFFETRWPQDELDALYNKEIEGRKVILPVWHDIDKAGMMKRCPLLAGKFARETAKSSIAEIADFLVDDIKHEDNRVAGNQLP